MAVGDVYELVHEQSYQTQDVNNVYHFLVNDAGGTAQALAAWFGVTVVPVIKAAQDTSVNHINVRVRNLFNSGDNYEYPLSGGGTYAGASDQFPSFVSAGFTLQHDGVDIRPGSKRIICLQEDSQDEGVWIASALAGVLDDIAAIIDNPLSGAAGGWTHIVVGRILRPADAEHPAPYYDLPENQSELEYGSVSDVEILTQVTTQNSRKWYT